ncbi:MAG: response regulator [Spirulina sp. SIO3F2]|nr:response regulator [Spirulina sp. SIO3F2]
MTKQVLVIDDEADIREITQLSLAVTTDWDVRTAASGQEGLDMVRDRQPDLVLLDLMMPDMDGQATCAHLKENPQTQAVPVIFLTAKVQVKDQLELAQAGVEAIFTKPFDPTTLGAEISEVLGWQN